MNFASIPAHTAIKRRLCYIAQHRQVPHAQLLWGAAGSAQLPLALAFAQYIHCTNRSDQDACGRCASCLKMEKLSHPDLQFIFPISNTPKSTNKGNSSNQYLPAWRTFIQEQPYGLPSHWSYHLGSEQKQLAISKEEAKQITRYVSTKPLESNYKITLIWLPEYFHPSAANALLKVLEEPSPQAIFLLASLTPEKVIDTIRSRTQQIYVPPFSDQALAYLLNQQYGLSEEQLQQIVPLANGDINQAKELIENNQKDSLSQFTTWMRLCYNQNLAQLIIQADTFQQLDKEAQKDFLAYTLHLLRESLVVDLNQTQLSKAPHKEQMFVAKFKKTLTYDQIKCFTEWINQAYYYLERNVNTKILWLNLSLKVAQSFNKS
jgi:DNA polymerase-3 subunit delta'